MLSEGARTGRESRDARAGDVKPGKEGGEGEVGGWAEKEGRVGMSLWRMYEYIRILKRRLISGLNKGRSYVLDNLCPRGDMSDLHREPRLVIPE